MPDPTNPCALGTHCWGDSCPSPLHGLRPLSFVSPKLLEVGDEVDPTNLESQIRAQMLRYTHDGPYFGDGDHAVLFGHAVTVAVAAVEAARADALANSPFAYSARDVEVLVEAARQEGEQLSQAWADLVQIYGDQLMIDQATTMGLWPEQTAVPVPEEETQP